MNAAQILSPRPRWREADLTIPDVAWGQYIEPCQVIRLDCRNLRVRGEDELDFLLMDSLQLADSLGHLNAPALHQVFGVGYALARVIMRMLWVRDLIVEASGPAKDPLGKYKGYLFDDSVEPKADIEDRYDRWHTLSEEGKRVIDTGEFEPLQLEDRVLYFLEPGGVMLPLEAKLPNSLEWKEANDPPLSIENLATWFQPGERGRRCIPEQVYGLALEETKVFDDYGEEKDPLPPTIVKVSACTPSNGEGIWFVRWLGGSVTDNPSMAQNLGEGYWHSRTWHPATESPEGGGWAKMPRGRAGRHWKINPVKGRAAEVPVTRLTVEPEKFFLELQDGNPPNEWLPINPGDEPEVVVISYHPQKQGALLHLLCTPLPDKRFVGEWIHQATEQLEFPLDRVLTKIHVEEALNELGIRLETTWRLDGRRRASWKKRFLEPILEVETFVQRRYDRGDWLLRYRLDEQEVFAHAV